MSDATTFILRFRDLVTEPGGTISRHNAISEAMGSVWWAWWKKAGETVPVDEMQRFRMTAEGGGLTIYLHDSGQNKLYTATCLDIDWTQSAGKASPDKRLTPNYYRQRPYRMWFRLGSIVEVPNPTEVLQRLTCVEVGEFFETGVSRYRAFYGKVIFDSEELTEQNRTIWFVRDRRAEDRTGRMVLLDAAVNAPSHFPHHYIQVTSTKVMWLSDLHFSAATPRKNHHAFALPDRRQGVHKATLHGAIARDFPTADFGALLVSGDLTWRADPAEFVMAAQAMREIMIDTRVDPTRLVVVPGNHDLAYSKKPEELASKVEYTTEEAQAAYTTFYRDLFHEPPSKHLAMGRRLLFPNGVLVEVLALNSSALQQAPNKLQGHGYVGPDQLADAAKAMGWEKEDWSKPQKRRAFRVAMLHHHLVPMNYLLDPERLQGFSVSLDAEAIMRWLVDYRVDLVLHGHMHEPGLVRIEKPVDRAKPDGPWHSFTVAGMGTSGARADGLAEVEKNTVGIVDFQNEAVEISIQTIHPTLQPAPVWKARINYPS